MCARLSPVWFTRQIRCRTISRSLYNPTLCRSSTRLTSLFASHLSASQLLMFWSATSTGLLKLPLIRSSRRGIMRMVPAAGGRDRHHVGALIVLVALLGESQIAAASRSPGFATRLLLQAGSCSASSPCPNSAHCCSQFGYCGTGPDFCGTGCKSGPCTASTGSCSATSSCPNSADCCSQYNFCGSGPDYCGTGCKNGPCTGSSPGTGSPPSTGSPVFSAFFTKAIFESWFPNRQQNFYTYEAFTAAAAAYPTFGSSGSSVDDQKREIAAFFANVQQETGGLQYIEEIDKTGDYCDENNTQYPCAAGKLYYGRGAVQLSWNYNYGECGTDLGLNLVANPDQVAQSGTLAFRTALWFWMKRNCHGAILNQSFAGTIRIINGGVECDHGFDQRVENRVNAYTGFCSSLNVAPGTDLRC